MPVFPAAFPAPTIATIQQSITVNVTCLASGESGWPRFLHVGSAYTTANGAAWRLDLVDQAGNPVSSLGEQDLATADIVVEFGRISTINRFWHNFTGTATIVPAVGAEPLYIIVEIPATETGRAFPDGRYRMQVILWKDTEHQRVLVEREFTMKAKTIPVGG